MAPTPDGSGPPLPWSCEPVRTVPRTPATPTSLVEPLRAPIAFAVIRPVGSVADACCWGPNRPGGSVRHAGNDFDRRGSRAVRHPGAAPSCREQPARCKGPCELYRDCRVMAAFSDPRSGRVFLRYAPRPGGFARTPGTCRQAAPRPAGCRTPRPSRTSDRRSARRIRARR